MLRRCHLWLCAVASSGSTGVLKSIATYDCTIEGCDYTIGAYDCTIEACDRKLSCRKWKTSWEALGASLSMCKDTTFFRNFQTKIKSSQVLFSVTKIQKRRKKRYKKDVKNTKKRPVSEHTCYQTYFRTCVLLQKSVPLHHPKNNLFTLKKLILIENRKAWVVRFALFHVYDLSYPHSS